MGNIIYDDFAKLDIRVAKIVEVEDIEGADKLLKLTLDVGDLGERTIAAGIKEHYEKEGLKGRLIIYLSNLEPKKLKGVMSEGMLLAADDGKPILLQPEGNASLGSKIK